MKIPCVGDVVRTTAMIIANRARKPVELSTPTAPFIAPHGVGGGPLNKFCVGFHVGNHRVIITKDEWSRLHSEITALMQAEGYMW